MAQLTVEQAFQTGVQHHQSGRFRQAEQLYRQVLTQQPNHPEALHLLGLLAHAVGRSAVAVDLIGRSVALKPHDPEAQYNFGVSLQAMGMPHEAIATYRRAVALKPDFSQAHHNLGNALKDVGQLEEAIVAFRRALALQPNSTQSHNNLGIALAENGQLDQAIAAYRQAIAFNSSYGDAYSNLGIALKKKGELQEAAAACRRAVAIQPGNAQSHYNLSVVLHAQGQFDEAIAAARQAIVLKPHFPDARCILGIALQAQGYLSEAIMAYDETIAQNPNFATAHSNLGQAMTAAHRPDEAIAACLRAIALEPQLAQAHCNLGVALKDAGDLNGAIAAHRKSLALDSSDSKVHSSLAYTLHFHAACDARMIAAEHRRWNDLHAGPLKISMQPHTNDRTPGRRLRVGYVSPDFREHPVGRFLLPLLAHHDKGQVDVFAYAQVRCPDKLTSQFRSYADHWRDTTSLSDAETADLIRQDGIDILVDLTMHMANGRLLVFARKPAPVQVSYLAYCSTTGLETMDYRLSDPYLDPPGVDESVYSEQTIRLPETYWCYQPVIEPLEVSTLPALERGHITFGCLNNFCKITEPVLSAWEKILAGVPNSRLLVHAYEGSHRQRLRERLARNNIDPNRVEFVGMMPARNYFELYRRIHIALDTFPYGGGTTTCDAIWMGVPVVTLVGSTAVGRGGVSVLSNIGLLNLVAHSEKEYVSLAIELAGDLPKLLELRSTLRRRMEQSPIMNAGKFARDIEAAFRGMWREWCGRSWS